MAVQHTIRGSDLHHLLRRAAEESVVATLFHCLVQSRVSPEHRETARLEEELAWTAARVTECGWALLAEDAEDARAPIAWAVQEVIEWAEHMVRFEALGDRDCRVPLTWLPRGAHPLGTTDVVAAVEERAALLCEELAEHGVAVATAPRVEIAA
jgi:hypothetical protein